MDSYIEQLISQIRKASLTIRPPRNLWNDADVNSEVELEDMAYVEKYFEGEEEPIEDITGIAQHLLPSPEELNPVQKGLLATELEHLLLHFNFCLDFPKNLPAHFKYSVIFSFWKESHVAVSFGKNCIELCDMEKENCPFSGYCTTCDEIAAQMKHDEEIEEKYKKQKGLETNQDLWDPFGEVEKNEPFFEEINGFYNDEGEKIDPETVPVPNLCVICKKHMADDSDENLLCLMNRYDQRNDDDFKCGMFENI